MIIFRDGHIVILVEFLVFVLQPSATAFIGRAPFGIDA